LFDTLDEIVCAVDDCTEIPKQLDNMVSSFYVKGLCCAERIRDIAGVQPTCEYWQRSFITEPRDTGLVPNPRTPDASGRQDGKEDLGLAQVGLDLAKPVGTCRNVAWPRRDEHTLAGAKALEFNLQDGRDCAVRSGVDDVDQGRTRMGRNSDGLPVLAAYPRPT
jgi:hypothetical protein